MSELHTKICSKCKNIQELSCFYKQSRSKDGYQTNCKSCCKQYNTLNKEAIIAYSKKYYQDNKKLISERHTKYNSDNKEATLTYRKEYNIINKEKIALQRKAYRAINSKAISEWSKEYYENNTKRLALMNRLYTKTPKGKENSRNAYNKRRSLSKQSDVTAKQVLDLREETTHCHYCEVPLKDIKVEIDHYYPLSKGGKHTISNLRIACQTCNRSKGAKDPIDFIKSLQTSTT